MAVDLYETLDRLRSKTVVLLDIYNALKSEKDRVQDENADLQKEIIRLRQELKIANTKVEYLQTVRNISQSPEDIAKSKAVLSKLVQDVERCIIQLTD